MTGRAPEHRFDDPGADLCGFAQDAFDRNKFVDIFGSDIPDCGLFGEIDEPDIDAFGLFPVLAPYQLVVFYCVPDILKDLARGFQQFIGKADPCFSEPFDLPVIDKERALVGVFPGQLPSSSCTGS